MDRIPKASHGFPKFLGCPFHGLKWQRDCNVILTLREIRRVPNSGIGVCMLGIYLCRYLLQPRHVCVSKVCSLTNYKKIPSQPCASKQGTANQKLDMLTCLWGYFTPNSCRKMKCSRIRGWSDRHACILCTGNACSVFFGSATEARRLFLDLKITHLLWSLFRCSRC